MNILIVSAQKPDSTGSGVYLAATAGAFVRMGHRVAVVAGVDVADEPALPEGVSFLPVRYGTPGLPFDVCGMSDVMPYPSTRYRDMTPAMVERLYAAFAEKIGEALRSFRPDLVLCHHLYLVCALTARLVRELMPSARVAALSHSTDLRQMRSHDLERETVLAGVRDLDRILALHEQQAAQIVEVYGVDPARIAVVGTGYDDRVFRAEGEGPRFSQRLELCYVGKVSRAKGVMSLLKALQLLPYGRDDLRLRLIGGAGSAQEGAYARELADAAPCSVEFCGRVPTDALVRAYRESHVFVLPSFYEGLPLVVVEAMACGCRVVVTDLPGIRPWLDAHLRDAPVTYVAPPRMLAGAVDEPVPADLPAFERRLADAIASSLDDARRDGRPTVDTHALTWGAVAARILAACA